MSNIGKVIRLCLLFSLCTLQAIAFDNCPGLSEATPAQPEALLHVGGEISQGRGGSSSYKRHRPGDRCTGNRRLLWAHIHRTNKPINIFRNQPKQVGLETMKEYVTFEISYRASCRTVRGSSQTNYLHP
ncbi:uncharacterized protein [Heterodontus francisci]|uniref:uncharacterized protein isoform X2 n=1 Tax=Heterodontus francisci TaxID=7792 RepID=UPI00355BAE80